MVIINHQKEIQSYLNQNKNQIGLYRLGSKNLTNQVVVGWLGTVNFPLASTVAIMFFSHLLVY